MDTLGMSRSKAKEGGKDFIGHCLEGLSSAIPCWAGPWGVLNAWGLEGEAGVSWGLGEGLGSPGARGRDWGLLGPGEGLGTKLRKPSPVQGQGGQQSVLLEKETTDLLSHLSPKLKLGKTQMWSVTRVSSYLTVRCGLCSRVRQETPPTAAQLLRRRRRCTGDTRWPG